MRAYPVTPTNETRLNLRISSDMKRDLKIAAAEDRRDMSDIVRELISLYLADRRQ